MEGGYYILSFLLILRSWKFLFLNIFFSFSFRQSKYLIWKLNSECNLTRKQLNLELFPEGGFQFLFYKFIRIQTAISQVIYETLQKFVQL